MIAAKRGQVSRELKYELKEEKGHTHIRESTCGQSHRNRAHQCTGHDQQVRVRVLHANADLADKGQDDKGSDGVRDESGHDKDERTEDQEDAVQTEVLDAGGDTHCDCVQQAG